MRVRERKVRTAIENAYAYGKEGYFKAARKQIVIASSLGAAGDTLDRVIQNLESAQRRQPLSLRYPGFILGKFLFDSLYGKLRRSPFRHISHIGN